MLFGGRLGPGVYGGLDEKKRLVAEKNDDFSDREGPTS